MYPSILIRLLFKHPKRRHQQLLSGLQIYRRPHITNDQAEEYTSAVNDEESVAPYEAEFRDETSEELNNEVDRQLRAWTALETELQDQVTLTFMAVGPSDGRVPSRGL